MPYLLNVDNTGNTKTKNKKKTRYIRKTIQIIGIHAVRKLCTKYSGIPQIPWRNERLLIYNT